ncbi:MAG: S8 family peptidase [Prolixibacteraceae bacterium]|nr:S8 family peptidase [Prolixibacteraceae bacterium]MBN2650020.1 S8 family peptidase [Prolixibacteraceae bacterium]
MFRIAAACLLFIFFTSVLKAEVIYWVQFNTKAGTPYSINKPQNFLSQRAIERRIRQNIAIDSTDLPVNPAFIDSLNSMGLKVKHTSRWFNAAIITTPDTTLVSTLVFPSFIDTIEIRKNQLYKSSSTKFNDEDSLLQNYYGTGYRQIEMLKGHLLHEKSTGKGIWVAVIDAGFSNADKLEVFDSLYARNGLLGTRDFVTPGGNVFESHWHGTSVLSVMAANQPGSFTGTAPDASYWLLRTEDAATEYPVEEDYWIIAAEFADSIGCDITNTSLGYTTFDDPFFNHNYEQFDGNTLRVSKAANMAVEKGMVVVCSAGNSGNESWRHIAAPSEAEKVLSVAAVNNQGDTVYFSSAGFNSAPIPKPDIAAMGAQTTIASQNGNIVQSSGTSFSSPVIAGMAACMVDIFPEKNASEIISMIRQSGHLYPSHDVKYGYGIPDFSTLFKTEIHAAQMPETSIARVHPNPFSTFIILTDENTTHLTLYNSNGNMVFSSPVSKGQSKISSPELLNLPQGLYFAIVKNQNKQNITKLIKK